MRKLSVSQWGWRGVIGVVVLMVGAHTPGDTMIWLQQEGVLLTGDVVDVECMQGVLPVSKTLRWLATFAVIEQLNPQVLVPSHGSVTNLATAKADNRAELLPGNASRTYLEIERE